MKTTDPHRSTLLVNTDPLSSSLPRPVIMHTFNLALVVNVLLACLVSVPLISSASFPNPPQRPPSNASPDEQAMFWKLLHNYYAIIARPRFGKRFDGVAVRPKPASIVTVLEEENSSSVDDDLSNVLPERFYSLGRLQPAGRR